MPIEEDLVRPEITDMWRKLNHLVPEPQCSTRGNNITEWHDTRTMPTYDELAAVLIADVEVSEQDVADERGEVPSQRHMLRLLWKMFNSIRVLESKPPIAWKNFIRRIRDIT